MMLIHTNDPAFCQWTLVYSSEHLLLIITCHPGRPPAGPQSAGGCLHVCITRACVRLRAVACACAYAGACTCASGLDQGPLSIKDAWIIVAYAALACQSGRGKRYCAIYGMPGNDVRISGKSGNGVQGGGFWGGLGDPRKGLRTPRICCFICLHSKMMISGQA